MKDAGAIIATFPKAFKSNLQNNFLKNVSMPLNADECLLPHSRYLHLTALWQCVLRLTLWCLKAPQWIHKQLDRVVTHALYPGSLFSALFDLFWSASAVQGCHERSAGDWIATEKTELLSLKLILWTHAVWTLTTERLWFFVRSCTPEPQDLKPQVM